MMSFHASTALALAAILLVQSPGAAVGKLHGGGADWLLSSNAGNLKAFKEQERQEQTPGGSVTTYSYSSPTNQIGKAAVDFVIGLLVVIIAHPILWFNERRQAKMWSLFGRAEHIAVSDVSADKINEENDARLVHIVGQTATEDALRDEDLGVVVRGAAKLQRDVSMFQWHERKQEETRNTAMGGKETFTTYTYYQDWSSDRVDSSAFQESFGHENPPMPLQNRTQQASLVTLGAFQLPSRLAAKMSNFVPLTAEELPEQAPAPPGSKALVLRNGVYTTEASGQVPAIGDVRVTLKKVPCADATVLGVQNGNRLAPLTYEMNVEGVYVVRESSSLLGNQARSEMLESAATSGVRLEVDDITGCCAVCKLIGACVEGNEEIFELLERRATLREVLKAAQGEQQLCHCLLQILGWVLLFAGFWMMFAFVPALFRIIPLIGVWIQLFGNFLAGIAAFLISTMLWCLVVALAWLSMRPIKALLLLIIGAALVVAPTLLAHK